MTSTSSHATVRDAVQLWADRLITDLEFVRIWAKTECMALPDDADPAGLLDPNTGLRYPTKQGA
jgi:hypothetical protein